MSHRLEASVTRLPIGVITSRYIDAYHSDMVALGVLSGTSLIPASVYRHLDFLLMRRFICRLEATRSPDPSQLKLLGIHLDHRLGP
jgi:hypothetical protein